MKEDKVRKNLGTPLWRALLLEHRLPRRHEKWLGLFYIIPRFYIKYFFIRIFKKKEEPGISVIIPCYNLAKYLEEAVQSVVNQDYSKFEIIIINDASTDNTKEIARNLISKYKNFDIKLIENERNKGLAESRNIGIKESNYDLIYLLDADDKIHPKALKTLYMFMQFHHAYLACPGVIKFNSVKEINWMRPITYRHLFIDQTHAGVLINKKAWKTIGGYSKNMLHGWEDWDFTLSFIEDGLKVIDVAKPLYYYRRGRGKESMASSLRASEKLKRKMLIQLIKNHPKLYSGYKIEDIVRGFRYREINENLFRKELEEIEFIEN